LVALRLPGARRGAEADPDGLKASSKTATQRQTAKAQIVTPVVEIQAPAKIAQAPTSLLRTKLD
jgi:hypothetical protein